MTQRLLICTDLDRTLLPNGCQPESPSARAAFARLVARPEITLAYVSGRHRELVENAIYDYCLPSPDWVIGDVGTTIYQVDAQEWRPCLEWEQRFATDWQGLTANGLQPLFADLLPLRLQERAKQNRYKLSYYLPVQTDVAALQCEMLRRLDKENLAASLIYSIDDAASVGLLDVLPARAGKRHAVEFLMRHLGFDCTNTVFAGDSGNDLPVFISAVPSVLVANASDHLVEQARTQAALQGNQSALYWAKGGFLGMNGNYSAGILEGVAHYHPETQPWMEQSHEQ